LVGEGGKRGKQVGVMCIHSLDHKISVPGIESSFTTAHMFLMHEPEPKHKSFFVMKTNQMLYFDLIDFANRPQHFSDLFLMHGPESKHKSFCVMNILILVIKM
jgi:hypothetical protein